jgi:hypothetical protein
MKRQSPLTATHVSGHSRQTPLTATLVSRRHSQPLASVDATHSHSRQSTPLTATRVSRRHSQPLKTCQAYSLQAWKVSNATKPVTTRKFIRATLPNKPLLDSHGDIVDRIPRLASRTTCHLTAHVTNFAERTVTQEPGFFLFLRYFKTVPVQV